MQIVVPDHQLSLAIGREGQNARLSATLTGWRIDIKSETQAEQTGFLDDEEEVKDDVLTEDFADDAEETTENAELASEMPVEETVNEETTEE